MDSTTTALHPGNHAMLPTSFKDVPPSSEDTIGPGKPPEAKDFTVDQTPRFDLGAAFGGHRVALILGGVLFLSIGVGLAAISALVLTIAKAQTATVTVDGSTGRLVTENGSWVFTDKTLYNRELVVEFVKRFFDSAYTYDYRAGPAGIATAKAFVAGGRASASIIFPDSAYVDRLDQAKTRTTITYDSAAVWYAGRANRQSTIAVLLIGTRTAFNVVNNEATGGRRAAFQDTVYVRTVQPSPQYPEGMAIYGVKGDLTW